MKEQQNAIITLVNKWEKKAIDEMNKEHQAKRDELHATTRLGIALANFKKAVQKINEKDNVINDASNFDFLFDHYITKEENDKFIAIDKEYVEKKQMIKDRASKVEALILSTDTHAERVALLEKYQIISEVK